MLAVVKKFSVIMTEQTKNILVIAQKNRSMTEKNNLGLMSDVTVLRGGHLWRNYFTYDSACTAIIIKQLR